MSESSSTDDFEDLFEKAPCGYASLLPNGRIHRVNQTLCDWIGRSAEEVVGEPVHELLGFGGRIAFETHLAPLLRMQGYVYEIALDLVSASKEKIPVIANASEGRDSQGHHRFTRLTLFRAIDRRTYERTLLEGRRRAEAEAKAERETALLREQFIAVLGHDLRNPLFALSAGIERICRTETVSERGLLILREMRKSAKRAMSLIENVLDLARSRSAGGLDLDRRESDVEPVFEQVVAEIRSIVPDREIQSDIDVPKPVLCDSDRLAQLASNLLSNAVTHGAPEASVKFCARLSDGELVLSVANSGKPIPTDVREHLFRPFFRGVARSSSNGLGLGLFIANEIASAHGGTLEVSSTEKETRFTLRIPQFGEPVSDQ